MPPLSVHAFGSAAQEHGTAQSECQQLSGVVQWFSAVNLLSFSLANGSVSPTQMPPLSVHAFGSAAQEHGTAQPECQQLSGAVQLGANGSVSPSHTPPLSVHAFGSAAQEHGTAQSECQQLS